MWNALIAQGGGATPVINASLAGAVLEAQKSGNFRSFLGSAHGLQGLLQGRYFDLFSQAPEVIEGLAAAPGAALGSSRAKLSDSDLDQALTELRRRDIRCLFFIGGNGSMGTALTLDRAAQAAGYELHVIGIPKTVDNDLFCTDHTPGYGSAGRFYSHAIRDMGMDHRALPSPILICEVIGRNVGWIVAASAFARHYEDDAPHLIYMPERRLPRAQLLADIERVYKRYGRAFVAICEGQLDENGEPFDADVDRPDVPQHRLASNLAQAVAKYVTKELRLRARSERPALLGRSCSTLVSETDRAEAELCGRAAVQAALMGETGKMVALRRDSSEPYSCSTFLVPLEEVSYRERQMPAEFIAPDGNDVTQAYLDYAAPLVGPVPFHARLS